MTGPILDRFAAMGPGVSPLGFPVSDRVVSREGGEHVLFTGGKMFWHMATGAHPVWGAIGGAHSVPGGVRGEYRIECDE